MGFGLIVCLMSVFQIYHQSLSNTLIGYEYSTTQLSVLSALFPMGKFFGTFLMLWLCKKLIFSFFLLCVARIVIGFGVGIAFISAFVALDDMAFKNHATSMARRQYAFILAAILFSLGAFFANAVAYFSKYFAEYSLLIVFSIPAIISGLLYFIFRFQYLEPGKNNVDFSDEFMCDKCLKANNQELFSFAKKQKLIVRNKNATFLAILLMIINATIGVPIILAFSLPIYEALGMANKGAVKLSIAYPLVQLLVVWVWRLRVSSFKTSNRLLILYGYAACLMTMFLFLITILMPTLNEKNEFKKFIGTFWLTLLAVLSAPPCNAGTIMISELFLERNERIQGMAISRSIFWIFSSFLCGIFLSLMRTYSLFWAFLPCFVVSVFVYMIIFLILPENLATNECSVLCGENTERTVEYEYQNPVLTFY